jgi:hypothetical protein
VTSEQEQLQESKLHVEQAQQRIEDQLALIEHLRSEGRGTAEAERLLATYLQVMETFRQHRDTLAARLQPPATKPL